MFSKLSSVNTSDFYEFTKERKEEGRRLGHLHSLLHPLLLNFRKLSHVFSPTDWLLKWEKYPNHKYLLKLLAFLRKTLSSKFNVKAMSFMKASEILLREQEFPSPGPAATVHKNQSNTSFSSIISCLLYGEGLGHHLAPALLMSQPQAGPHSCLPPQSLVSEARPKMLILFFPFLTCIWLQTFLWVPLSPIQQKNKAGAKLLSMSRGHSIGPELNACG